MDWWRKKKNKKQLILERGAMLLEDLIECCDGKSNPIKFFSDHEIFKSTNNFNVSNRVSELSYSGYNWYSGEGGLFRFSTYREGTFCRDIAVSSMVSGHKNFLKLVGCFLEFKNPVIVYHNVKKHYKLRVSEQPWKRRMKIAEDIATALAYLHTAFPRPFVYRTMSLESILLDEDGVAKLRDFSDCVSIPEGETFVEERVKGTFDFLDPAYLIRGIVSEKTDVFAIGITMKMLLMGQKRFIDDKDDDDFATMSEMNDQMSHFLYADPKMLEMMCEISEEELCQMKAFRMLSLRCIGLKGEVPTMVEVAKELKKIQRSLNHDSFSPSGETQFDSAQVISSTVALSNQTVSTKALLTGVACQLGYSEAQLQFGFYSETCPSAESIVRDVVQQAVTNDPGKAAVLLRLQFHDCFVEGCDGSILIKHDGNDDERFAAGNAGVAGFDVIDEAKSELERLCPGVVSCADIVALAARDAIAEAKGPSYEVPTGRRDGRIANVGHATNLPDVQDSINTLKSKFREKGLSDQDLVLLSAGAHTIGTTACFFVIPRLDAQDPTINPEFFQIMRSKCPQGGDVNVRIPLDWDSQFVFDDQILRNIKNGRGVILSDSVLYQDNNMKKIIDSYLDTNQSSNANFAADFAKAMVKMGAIGVKIGVEGEIRRLCNDTN